MGMPDFTCHGALDLDPWRYPSSRTWPRRVLWFRRASSACSTCSWRNVNMLFPHGESVGLIVYGATLTYHHALAGCAGLGEEGPSTTRPTTCCSVPRLYLDAA